MPFIFLTALGDRDNQLKGRRLGADDYVVKPIDFEILDYHHSRAPRQSGAKRNLGASNRL